MAFLPGDSGMSKESHNDGNGGSDKAGKPEEIVVLNDEIGKNRV